MVIKYLTFSISISFISWIIGIGANAMLMRTKFYNDRLTNLHFFKHNRFGKIIGLNAFKWIVQHSFFKYFNPKLSVKKVLRPNELDSLRHEMTVAEIGHLCAFLFVVPFAVVKLVNGAILFAVVIMAVNVLMNLYPSLLQQDNKNRIDRFKKRMLAKKLT